jgi:hypothetical protein
MSGDAGSATAERADIRHFARDTKTLHSELATAQAKATHQSVASKIGTMNRDLATVTSGLQAVLRGNTSQLSQLNTAAGKLQGDGAAIDSTCFSL